MNDRRLVAAARLHAGVGRLIEVSEEAIVIALRDRVVLMVVALSTLHRQAEPHERRRLHAIDRIFHAKLFGDRPAFVGRGVVAVEAGGDLLIARGVGQQIAGELLDGELVVRLVFVVGLDHPIAPGPHVAWAIGVEDAAVAVARRIEPGDRHPLAVVLRRQQTVDRFFVSVRARVGEKGVDLFDRRRQAGEVERHAAQQALAVGFGGRRQFFLFEPREDERVDRVDHALAHRHLRNFGLHRRDERPMPFELRPALDPLAQRFDIGRLQFDLRLGRRHLLIGVGRVDPPPRFAFVQPAGERGRDAVGVVEPQIGFAMLFIRPVALEAAAGEQRANVAIEPRGTRRISVNQGGQQQRGKGEGDTSLARGSVGILAGPVRWVHGRKRNHSV